MITKEQSMAYTELIEVLKYMSKEDVDKLPKDILDFYQTNMDTSYNFKVDTSKPFDEQILLEKTKIVLAILFRDYWATDAQREKIKKKETYDNNLLEEEKREKYANYDLFNKKKSQEVETTALVEYKKEPWYNKFLDFMRKIFGKKK